MRLNYGLLASLAMMAGGVPAALGQTPKPPHVVYILCDDLGYGDVHCLNPDRGKIPTPNLDRLRAQGMAFTDAHSCSAVCTPSRYGILTGRYAWRTRLQDGVLNGVAHPLIARDRLTVPELLRRQGYATACIGKWHLGMEFGKSTYADPILDGPLQHGFDHYFGISTSPDMPPFVYISQDRFTQIPTTIKTWHRTGPAAADFEAVQVLPDLVKHSTDYIAQQAKTNRPFFLYLALTSPHTPILPTPEWKGRSGLGDYGDFVMETDWAVGEVLKALDTAGLQDSTMVWMTSDNGFSPYAGATALETQGHYPSADFRGYKADIWEGGHRVPLIVRWPGVVKPGSECPQTVGLNDLMATCADMLATKLPDNAGEDSVSLLPLLRGGQNAVHEAVVHHSIHGHFALRQGRWKLELCAGSGGWATPKEQDARDQHLPRVQLYDMTADLGERENLQAHYPEVVQQLTRLLETYVETGRSTPGTPQKNDVPVRLWKEEAKPKTEIHE